MSELASGFAPILAGDSVAAAVWSLPDFGGTRAAPPTAQALEEIEAAAYREGEARGYADGLARGRAAAQVEAARLRELLAHLQRPAAELDAGTERAMVALTLELARRLVQQELAADPAKIAAIVHDAVGHLSQPVRAVAIRLHPDDAAIVSGHLQPRQPGEDWRVIPDRTLMPGDCIVETDGARVDARLDTRQALLAQHLLGEDA